MPRLLSKEIKTNKKSQSYLSDMTIADIIWAGEESLDVYFCEDDLRDFTLSVSHALSLQLYIKRRKLVPFLGFLSPA